ncbi:alpha/beta hydrolase [Haloarculaceae archaeon H-GB11]|nr:alpha/beta hydrolase [Haloarculaceae archaeon H-GB11]
MPGDDPRTISLPDGRTLAFAEYGDPDGYPILFFHGTPGSRLGARMLADAASELDLRIVAPDRPGIGESDGDSRRSLLDWPADVSALLDALSIADVGIVGFSAGGPYALACAHELPDRVAGVSLVSTVGPSESLDPADIRSQFVYATLSHAPWLVRGPYRAISYLARSDRGRLRRVMTANASPADTELLKTGTGDIVFDDFAEAFAQGTSGAAHDTSLLARSWDFDLEDVTVPVSLWHGRNDQTIPASVASRTAEALPASKCSLLDAEGHFSTLRTADEAICWQATRRGRAVAPLDD